MALTNDDTVLRSRSERRDSPLAATRRAENALGNRSSLCDAAITYLEALPPVRHPIAGVDRKDVRQVWRRDRGDSGPARRGLARPNSASRVDKAAIDDLIPRRLVETGSKLCRSWL